jgi:bacterial/archaeal transporter family protein
MKQTRSTWLVYALLCIIWWGIWGFLSKLGSDRISPQQLQILFTIGILPSSLVAWAQLGFKVETDLRGAIYGILNGVFTGLGMLAYYAALSEGKAAVVGPFTALFPLLTVALAFAFLRERINRIQFVGMLLALAAIIILSF